MSIMETHICLSDIILDTNRIILVEINKDDPENSIQLRVSEEDDLIVLDGLDAGLFLLEMSRHSYSLEPLRDKFLSIMYKHIPVGMVEDINLDEMPY